MSPVQVKARVTRAPEIDLAGWVYLQIRDLIVVGRVAPGAPLIEADLAARLGVSRTPIRTALQRLQQEGWVIGSKIGETTRAVVTPLTADDMGEVFTIVGALEGVAARLAAELDAAKRTALVQKLEHFNDSLQAATEARPPEIAQAQDLHVRFHRCYVEAAAGPRLRAELDALQPQAERYERVYTTALVGEFDASLLEHQAIIQAIKAGDAEAAERNTANNWRNGAERYRRVVAILGERGTW